MGLLHCSCAATPCSGSCSCSSSLLHRAFRFRLLDSVVRLPRPCFIPPGHAARREASVRPKMAAELPYSPEVLALWNEKDEEASEKWRQDKIKDFEAGGA